MQAPDEKKVHNYLYNGVNAKKIEESNEKKKKYPTCTQHAKWNGR
jgi:hypothetical protein